MKKFICKALFIVCILSLIVLVSDCNADSSCEGNALITENATYQFPEEFLSQKIEWKTCEFVNNQKRLRKAECTDITVPLYWDNPEGDTMTIHVKRLKALLKATKQMWLLEGGPGYAGTFTLPQYVKTIAQLDWKADLYILDHRGTGYSERLGCPDQEAEDSEEGKEISENEWDACIDHLENTYNLDAFTVTQAARDLGFLVELLKEENKEIFVMGGSYGTYWGHRYVQIFPDQADGVVLDSVVPSVGSEQDQWDIDGNNVVKDFDICKEDAFCRSKMGTDPWGKANATFEKFKNGHCNEVSENGLSPEFLQQLAFGALDYWYLRIVLPAFYYRIDRCSEEDVKAFRHALDNFLPLILGQSGGSIDPSPPRPFTRALLNHIDLSELIGDNPVSPEEMKEIDKTLLASQHFSYKFLQLLERWPTYETDIYYRKWASQDVPILMLNGTLDVRSTIDAARIAKENLTGPTQYFIEVPNASHIVIFHSPVKNIFAPDCGMQIMLDFMKDPLEEPNTSCLDDLVPIDFHGNPLFALLLFGTWDLWENNGNANLTDNQISLAEEELEKILQDLRRRWPRLR